MQKVDNEDEEVFQLLVATNKERPKEEDVERLRQFLIAHPDCSANLGNLITQVRLYIIEKTFAHSKAMELSLTKYCGQLERGLGYKAANPLERTLIECVVLNRLRWQVCELDYNLHTKGVSFAQAEYWESKLSAAQKRYLRSVEARARVRRLLKDPLALLLKQQINVNR